MIVIDLICNLALLVALSVVSGFVDTRWKRTTRRQAAPRSVPSAVTVTASGPRAAVTRTGAAEEVARRSRSARKAVKSPGSPVCLRGRSATSRLAGPPRISRPEGFSLRLEMAPVAGSMRAV